MTLKWSTGASTTLDEIKAQVGKGWSNIIERLVTDLEKLGWDGTVFQVKEKFGGLRFYIGSGSNEVFKRISEAEKESYQTCENDGRPGKLDDSHYWVLTLCPECIAKRNNPDAV